MRYEIAGVVNSGMADSAFLVQLEKVAVSLARLDERMRRSEPIVQRGLLARTVYREAQSLVGLSGRLIHLVDLVLFDLDANVQMSSDASVLGRKYLAQLRRLSRLGSDALVSEKVISEISGLPVVLGIGQSNDREPDELDSAVSELKQLVQGSGPQIGEWYREIENLPVVFGSLVLLDAWQWHEGSPKTEIAPLLCSGYLRAHGFSRLLPPVAYGLWNSKVRWDRHSPPALRLASLASNLERSATLTMAELDRLILARASMERRSEGGPRRGSLKALADLFVEIPAVTVELAAKRLSITPQAVLQLMKRLDSARPPELTGRSRYRVWGVI